MGIMLGAQRGEGRGGGWCVLFGRDFFREQIFNVDVCTDFVKVGALGPIGNLHGRG